MSYFPKTHIQDTVFKSRALCGLAWSRVKSGGEVRSDTVPPAVFNPETKSVRAASCEQCCLAWRRSLVR